MSDIESENIADVEGPLEAEDDEQDVDDRFNLFFSITVAETGTTEIDNEFNEAVSEIEGKKSFECDKCDKVCKSKGGLTRHTNSKHGEPKKRATTNLGHGRTGRKKLGGQKEICPTFSDCARPVPKIFFLEEINFGDLPSTPPVYHFRGPKIFPDVQNFSEHQTTFPY